MRMTGRLYFILGSTFFMGVFAGVYLYVSAFAPTHQEGVADDQVDDDAIVLEGQMYGGCSRTESCASFRLIDGRKYNYLETTGEEVKKGILPKNIREDLEGVFDDVSLQRYAQKVGNTSCTSYVDGVDFMYTISKDGERYLWDTCTTWLSQDTGLQEVFRSVWYAMENPDENKEIDLFEKNIFDIFWDRFHQRS